MTTSLKALLIDDDPDASAWLAYTLKQRFPELVIETREAPDLSGAFDLYFIDNDFHGKSLAAELATTIRATNPTSMIVAFSARLDNRTLKLLVNAGCDGACEKNEAEDIEQMMRIVSAYLNRRRSEPKEQSKRGLMGAMYSIRNLLREWNRRLDSSSGGGSDSNPGFRLPIPAAKNPESAAT